MGSWLRSVAELKVRKLSNGDGVGGRGRCGRRRALAKHHKTIAEHHDITVIMVFMPEARHWPEKMISSTSFAGRYCKDYCLVWSHISLRWCRTINVRRTCRQNDIPSIRMWHTPQDAKDAGGCSKSESFHCCKANGLLPNAATMDPSSVKLRKRVHGIRRKVRQVYEREKWTTASLIVLTMREKHINTLLTL